MSTRTTYRTPIAKSFQGREYQQRMARKARTQAIVQARRGFVPRVIPGYTRRSGYYGGIERKFLDTAFSDGTLASAMTFYNPMVIPQGDTESQRIGRKVVIRSLHLRGTLTLLNATDVTNTSNQFRMRIVIDTQTNGAQFGATDLLETDAINSFSNLANRSRFRVLYDKTKEFNSFGASATGAAYSFGEVIKPISVNLKLNLPVEFDNSATTGAITTVRSNYICITMQSSTGEIISMAMTSRIRYTDN